MMSPHTKGQLNKFKHIPIYLYLLIYSTINYATILLFPTIHSDELWLMGLTNDMIHNKSLFVTESFFDLMPRTVHTIKSFFHLLQVIFISIFGYSITSIRLISLVAAVFCLYIFYRLLIRQNISTFRSLFYTVFLSLNIQFIYAGHFGRQEILLFLIMTICLFIYSKLDLAMKDIIIIAFILGLSIGFHPNAFIISCMIGILLLRDTLLKSIKWSWLLVFIAIIAGFAAGHISISLYNNPNFFSEYLTYGSSLGVNQDPSGRLNNFKDFYIKLYEQISGTYYIPPMKPYFIFGGLMMVAGLILPVTNSFLNKKINKSPMLNEFTHLSINLFKTTLMLIAYNIAIFIIGRFNTTSIIFALLPLILMFVYVLEFIFKSITITRPQILNLITALIFILTLFISSSQLTKEFNLYSSADYNQYLAEINPYITQDSVILGNLTSGELFNQNEFYDIRNLTFINKTTSSDESIESYINNRHIDTIIYYEEYDYIHRNQQWEILYGDDSIYYDDLQAFLNEKATLIHTFEDMYYGSRLIRYMGDYPWKIYIYKVN